MPTIFEAAETDNTDALKELKKAGASFNEKDSSGNTPLLTASYRGHLETVQWLLLDGGARITEANQLGNTALLLAAAYGHLDMVIWLLSTDGGAKISETNKFGNTPLLMAAYHGQLPILDYLIRNYYTAFEFNNRELEKFASLKNLAIRYYLDIVKLSSHQKIDPTELAFLLGKASECLKSEELSFVYLIIFWMQIKHKDRISTLFELPTKKFCLRNLLPFQQGELISYMFREGYLLDNWSTEENSLSLIGFSLNQNQIDTIKHLIKQSEKDLHLNSQASAKEKKKFYTDYYLKPLYWSLIHAFKTHDALDNALLDPYTYHLRLTDGPIVDYDIARWSAYHFCQRPQTLIKEHEEAYVRTTGSSRLSYYETLEKYLSNQSPEKKYLLAKLGNIPDANGERLYWVKEYPGWLESIGSKLGIKQGGQATLRLIGLKHIIPLREEIIQQVWDSTTHQPQPKPATIPGNHPVYHFKEQGLYWKLYPGLPGINDALHYLYRRLFGATGGVPWSATGLINVDGQVIPVLLSEDAGSFIKSNDPRLDELDPYALSKLILFTILTNTEDGKCENYTLTKNAPGLYDIYSVDNDQGLVEATVETGWVRSVPKLAVKSVLFCLDAMKRPLDKTAVQEFLAIKPMETLKAWLKDLIQLEGEYQFLFSECKDSFAQEKNRYRRSYLQMVLPIATVIGIAYKLQYLLDMLGDDPDMFPFHLQQRVEPVVADYYEEVLKEPSSATERFDKLVREGSLYGYNKITKSYSTTLTSVRKLFEFFVPDNQPDVVTPQVALQVVERAHQEWEKLKQEQVRLLQGEIARLSQLPLEGLQNLLKLTRLNQFHSQKRTLLLEAIAKRTDFTELHLRYPQDSLTHYRLSMILKNNTNLQHLTLTNAIGITSLKSLNNLYSLKKLKLTWLPQIKVFTATLPALTELTLKDNTQLEALCLDALQLRYLSVTDCQNMERLDLPQSLALESVIIESCPHLPLSDFYCGWPGFISRWSNVPAGFRKRLAEYIAQHFKESKPHEKVYNVVQSYLEGLMELSQICSSGRELSVACVYAQAGYNSAWVIAILLEALQRTSKRSDSPYFRFFIDYLNSFLPTKEEVQFKGYVPKLFKMFSIENAIIFSGAVERMVEKNSQCNWAIHRALERWEGWPRTALLGQIAQTKTKDEEILQFLFKALESEDRLLRLTTFDTLVALGVEDERLSQAMLKALVEINIPDISNTAIQALEVSSHKKEIIRSKFLPMTQALNSSEFVDRLKKDREYALEISADYLQFETLLEGLLNSQEDQPQSIDNNERVIVFEQKPQDVVPALPSIQPLEKIIKDESVVDSQSNQDNINLNPFIIDKIGINLPIINTKADQAANLALFLASEKGNLSAVKNIIKKHGTKPITGKDSLGNTALSLAANNGHFPVVDYLIRYYYIDLIFDEKEKKALESLKQNSTVRYYFDVVRLFSKSPDYKALNLVLNEATKELKEDEVSTVYFIYIWMEVLYRAKSPLKNKLSVIDEPSMQQLFPEHQSQLILHMIRQGYALKNWYINSKTLTISDMTLDKKQIYALEELIEQGEYEFCLRLRNSVIENNKIYLGINDQGLLEYTFRGTDDEIKTGLISSETLNCELSVPLTLDQIHSFPDLLEQIANCGCLRPQIEELILNHMRFTKEYQLRSKPPDRIYEKNMVYVETKDDFLQYTVIDPVGKKVTDTISGEELRKKGLRFALLESLFTQITPFKSIFPGILEITTKRKHTTAEINTKGYKTFLGLLKNQALLPKLKSMHLRDCDLFDDYDLVELYPILSQRLTLIHLNLDENHITEIGLLNLLEALFKEKKSQSKLQTLSVCLNKIEIITPEYLDLLASKGNILQELKLTGNMVVEDNKPNKRNHKNRVDALLVLFQALEKQAPNLNINMFLTATDVKLNRGNKNDYLFSITLANSKIIETVLQNRQFYFYDKLRFNEINHGGREEILPKMTPSEIFSALIAGISPMKVPKELGSSQISQSFFSIPSAKKMCKQVLSYHKDAPLKGKLITHALLKSQALTPQPSFLFPSEQLTLEKGFVYLIANNKGWDKEHSLLGYEYLTGYGQHTFRVAHLQFDEENNRTFILFEKKLNLYALVSWVRIGRLIAKFQVDTKNLKLMDKDIQEDKVHQNLPEIKYQKVIFGSSRKDNLMNCLTYCLLKMEKFANIYIDMNMTDCLPSTVVKNCIKKQHIEEKEGLEINEMDFYEENIPSTSRLTTNL